MFSAKGQFYTDDLIHPKISRSHDTKTLRHRALKCDLFYASWKIGRNNPLKQSAKNLCKLNKKVHFQFLTNISCRSLFFR